MATERNRIEIEKPTVRRGSRQACGTCGGPSALSEKSAYIALEGFTRVCVLMSTAHPSLT